MFNAEFVRQYTTQEVSEQVARQILETILDGGTIMPYQYISSMFRYGIDEIDGCCSSRAMIITRRSIMAAAVLGETSVRVHVSIKCADVYVDVLKSRGFSVKVEPLGNYVIGW